MKRKSQLPRTELIRLRKIKRRKRRTYSTLMCCFLILSVFTPTFRAIAETRDVNITPQGIETTLDPSPINSSLNTLTEREGLFDIDVEIDAEIEPDVSETEHNDYLDPSESDDDLEFDDDSFDDQVANGDDEPEQIPLTGFDGTNFAHGINHTMTCEEFSNLGGMIFLSNQTILVNCETTFHDLVIIGENNHVFVVDGGSISAEIFVMSGVNNTITIREGGSVVVNTINSNAINVDGGDLTKQASPSPMQLINVAINLTAGNVNLLSLAPTNDNFTLNMSGGNFNVYATNESFINSNFNLTGGNVTGSFNIENSTLNVADTAHIAALTIKNSSSMEMTGGTIVNLTIDDSNADIAASYIVESLYARNNAKVDLSNSTVTGSSMVFGSDLNILDSTLTLTDLTLHSFASVSVSNATTITGNTLSLTNNSVFTITDGSASFGNISIMASTINIAGGNLVHTAGGGSLLVPAGSALNMSGNGVLDAAGILLLVNQGTLTISENATINALQINSAGLPSGVGYTLSISGGRINVETTIAASANTIINMTDGIISGRVQLGNAHLTMSGGQITGGQASGVTIGANSRFTMNGGTISGNTTIGGGGGVLVNHATAVFEMSGGEIANNTASGSIGGGGVRVTNGTFNMTGGKITGNQANMGGGISVGGVASLAISDATISDNIGGGIYIANADLRVTNTSILENKTIENQSGGGIYIINGDLEIENSIINHNVAQHNGGGIASTNGRVQISGNSQFTGNSANLHGGAMYLTNNTETNIENTNFTQNRAAQDPDLPAECRTVAGAIADVVTCVGDGGAIYTDNFRELRTNNVIFIENVAIRPINVDFNLTNLDVSVVRAIHDENILNTTFSDDFSNGYNNYDIWDDGFLQEISGVDDGFYIVAFRGNGALWGVPPTGLIIFHHADWVVPTQHTLARFYYEFVDWNTRPDGTGTTFAPGEVITEPLDGDLVLYAQWRETHTTLTFDLNGGPNYWEFPTQMVMIGGYAIRPVAFPTKEDYVFVDWFTTRDGDVLFDFENTSITEATTIYAGWLRQGLNFTVPERLEFESQNIRDMRVIAPRVNPNWEITVIDTRTVTGGWMYRPSWRLTAKVDGPLRNTAGHTLHGAAIIFRVAGEADRHLSTESQELFRSNPLFPSITTNLVWGASEGFLLDVNPILALYGDSYGTTITWTLYDTP